MGIYFLEGDRSDLREASIENSKHANQNSLQLDLATLRLKLTVLMDYFLQDYFACANGGYDALLTTYIKKHPEFQIIAPFIGGFINKEQVRYFIDSVTS